MNEFTIFMHLIPYVVNSTDLELLNLLSLLYPINLNSNLLQFRSTILAKELMCSKLKFLSYLLPLYFF